MKETARLLLNQIINSATKLLESEEIDDLLDEEIEEFPYQNEFLKNTYVREKLDKGWTYTYRGMGWVSNGFVHMAQCVGTRWMTWTECTGTAMGNDNHHYVEMHPPKTKQEKLVELLEEKLEKELSEGWTYEYRGAAWETDRECCAAYFGKDYLVGGYDLEPVRIFGCANLEYFELFPPVKRVTRQYLEELLGHKFEIVDDENESNPNN